MYKLLVIFILVIFAFCPANALKLNLKEISLYHIPLAEFGKNRASQLRRPMGNGNVFSFYFKDLTNKVVPFYCEYNLTIKADGRVIEKKECKKSFICGSSALIHSRKPWNGNRLYFQARFPEWKKYNTKVLSLTGNMNVLCGEIKVFKVKMKDLQKHLGDLKAEGIRIHMTNKNKLPIIPVFTIKLDMGNIKHYFMLKDDISKAQTYHANTPNQTNKILKIFQKDFNNDNMYFVLIYAKAVKTENIKINFNVPLKWKTIKFPENKKMKLVPVNNKTLS